MTNRQNMEALRVLFMFFRVVFFSLQKKRKCKDEIITLLKWFQKEMGTQLLD